jgi:hypothetical protein
VFHNLVRIHKIGKEAIADWSADMLAEKLGAIVAAKGEQAAARH